MVTTSKKVQQNCTKRYNDTEREFSKLIRTVTTALWLFSICSAKPASRVTWLHDQPSFWLRCHVVSVSDRVCRRLRLVPKTLHVLSAIRRCLSVQSGVSNLPWCPCPTSAWRRCLAQTDKLQLNPFVVSQYSSTCFFFGLCWFLIVLTSDKNEWLCVPLDFKKLWYSDGWTRGAYTNLSGDRTESNERSNCSNSVCVVVCSTNIALPSVKANSVKSSHQCQWKIWINKRVRC